MVADNNHRNAQLCKPQEYQAFLSTRMNIRTHAWNFHVDDYSVSVPNPLGEVLGTFFLFELIRTLIVFLLFCVLNFADIIPNLWF